MEDVSMAIDMERAKQLSDTLDKMLEHLAQFHKLYNATLGDVENLGLIAKMSSKRDLDYVSDNIMKKMYACSVLVSTITPATEQLRALVDAFVLLRQIFIAYMDAHGAMPDLIVMMDDMVNKGLVSKDHRKDIDALSDLLKDRASNKNTN
jgi:hypothetical protein